MSKRIDLRIDSELYDEIETYRIENNLNNKQEAVKILLNDSLKSKKYFLYRLKNLLKF